MLNIIFSKDRPCQLDLFLRSFKKYFINWKENPLFILYTYSNSDYKNGYEIVKDIHYEFTYIQETDFRSNVYNIMKENSNNKYLTFYVDDMIFKNTFTMKSKEFIYFEKADNILCLSMRLSPRITFCYAKNRANPVPPFEKEYNTWTWKGCKDDWGYPLAVDGHIFKVAEIFPLLYILKFDSPNALEGGLAKRTVLPEHLTKMICFDEAKTMTLPFNRVQPIYNRSGNISASYLNEQWLEGLQISLKPYHNYQVNMVESFNVPLIFERIKK